MEASVESSSTSSSTSLFSMKRVGFTVCALGLLILHQGISVVELNPVLHTLTDAAMETEHVEEETVHSHSNSHSHSNFNSNSNSTTAMKTATQTRQTKTIRPIRNATKLHQIDNYKTGQALLLNLHPTHHGGTSFCGIIGRSGGSVGSPRYPERVPSFACWQDKDHLVDAQNPQFGFFNKKEFLNTTPVVTHKTLDAYIEALRPHFHMTSWEYDGVDEMRAKISETDWEHPRLVSVVITRDPLSRLLAGGTLLKRWYPGYNKGTLSHEGWWDYATNPKRQQTDNFFLRILEGTPRPDWVAARPRDNSKRVQNFMYTPATLPHVEILRGTFDLTQEHYERAVSVLNRFTIVLDIACLDEGFAALTDLLGLNRTVVDAKRAKSHQKRASRGKTATPHQSTRDRIGYDDVYEYLVEKHHWDTRLYEYSKTISLVDCNAV